MEDLYSSSSKQKNPLYIIHDDEKEVFNFHQLTTKQVSLY